MTLRKQKQQAERERQKRNGIEFIMRFAERFNKAKKAKLKEVEMNERN